MTRHPCCEALVGRRDVDRKAYVRQQVFIEGDKAKLLGPEREKTWWMIK